MAIDENTSAPAQAGSGEQPGETHSVLWSVLAVVVVLVMVLVGMAGRAPKAADCCVTVQVAAGSANKAFLDDERVQKVFREHGYEVRTQSFGSGELLTQDLSRYDLVFPAGNVTADQVLDRIRKLPHETTTPSQGQVVLPNVPQSIAFASPAVVLTWRPLVPLITGLGLVKNADGVQVFDLNAYLKLLSSEEGPPRWRDLPTNGAAPYHNANQVLLEIGDPVESAIGATFVAAASYVLNGEQVVEDTHAHKSMAKTITRAFKPLGQRGVSAERIFAKYNRNGITTPLVLAYESQYLRAKMAGTLDDQAVMMYLSPTLNVENMLLPRTNWGEAIMTLLQSDATLQRLATLEFGFRNGKYKKEFFSAQRRKDYSVTENPPYASSPTTSILEGLIHEITRLLPK